LLLPNETVHHKTNASRCIRWASSLIAARWGSPAINGSNRLVWAFNRVRRIGAPKWPEFCNSIPPLIDRARTFDNGAFLVVFEDGDTGPGRNIDCPKISNSIRYSPKLVKFPETGCTGDATTLSFSNGDDHPAAER
jgi:hypothetical protein